eukprot:GAFH01001056.1.p2 GENE.GAFH01001056.1~~GAFH01001056.1.p2  ORF type:complete len:599 (-),score=245.98 GAFH01001056.1:255-1958(-)
MLDTFTPAYLKAYAIAMVKKARMDYDAAQITGPLLSHWKPVDNSPVAEGWLVKEGGARKNWKRRYFIIRSNWVCEYYETEEAAHNPEAKPKGTMYLTGYKVREDPGGKALKKAKKLLKMFGMSEDMLPKPKEYPPFTFEVHHKRRRCWFIQCANQEEFDSWVKHFKNACWWARPPAEDWVGKEAFDEAIWETRWKLGRYGWWYSGGTQEQRLADMIVEQIDYAVLGEIWRTLQGPYFLRMKARNTVYQMLDSTIGTAVQTAWKAITDGIQKNVRPPIEAKLNESLQPLFDAQNNIKSKIIETIMSVVDPVLQQMVTPHMQHFSEFLIQPIQRGHEECYSRARELFAEIATKVEADGIPQGVKNPIRELCAPFYRRTDYWATLHAAWDQIEPLKEPLQLLGDLISHVTPWSLIWKIQRKLRSIIKHSMATFEMELYELSKQNPAALTDRAAGKAACQQAAERAMTRMMFDGTTQIGTLTKLICENILMPPFERHIIPMVTDLIKPIADLVPEPLKVLIDLEDMLSSTLTELVQTCIGRPLEAYLPPVPPRPEMPALPDGYDETGTQPN